MQQRYISLLDAKDQNAGVLRLRWDTAGVTGQVLGKGIPLEEGSLFVITPRGPVQKKDRPAPEEVLGAVIVQDGSCVLWGSCGFCRVDMEKEKVRVRLLLQKREELPVPMPAPVSEPRPEPAPEPLQEEPEEIPPEAEQQFPPAQVPRAKTAEERYRAVPEGAKEISGREEVYFMAEEIQGTLMPGNSPALREILQRAETIFAPPQQESAFMPRPLEAEEPSRPDPRMDRWEQGVAALLEAERPAAQARMPLAQPAQNPFPNAFPNTLWRRVYRPQGQGWYLEGTMRKGREEYRITAIPGEYRPVPPRHLQGFNRFIKAPDGGYWVRVVRQN